MSSLWQIIVKSPIVRGVAVLLAASGLIKLTERGLALIDKQPRAFLAVLALTLQNMRRTQTTRMAAALAYRTIFGVIPVLVVGLAVLGGFAKDDDIKVMVTKFMSYSGLDGITVGDGVGDGAGAGDAPAVDGAAGAAAPAAPAGVDQWISELIENYRKIPFNTIGFVGVIALIYAALSMLVEIEQAFNHVCRAPTGRSWARRVTQYWAMLTLGPIFLVASFYTQDRLQSILTELTATGVLSGFQRVALAMLSYVAPVVISTALLVIVYTSMPNVRLRLVPSISGAILSALLWEAGKRGFTEYIAYSTNYSRLYGSIALIPLFMLWVYLTWVIVLFGLQVAQALQTYGLARARGTRLDLFGLGLFGTDAASTPKIVDPAIVIPVAAAVARGFGEGKLAERGKIAREVGLDERLTVDLLERLVVAGFVHRVSRADGEDGYTLARPPEIISAGELLAAANELTGGTGPAGPRRSAAEALERIESPRLDALRSQTLRDYMPKGSDSQRAGASAATLPTNSGTAPGPAA